MLLIQLFIMMVKCPVHRFVSLKGSCKSKRLSLSFCLSSDSASIRETSVSLAARRYILIIVWCMNVHKEKNVVKKGIVEKSEKKKEKNEKNKMWKMKNEMQMPATSLITNPL